MPRSTVRLLVRGRNEPATAFSARTDADGGFTLLLPEGAHIVIAQGGGCRDMRRPIDDPLGTEFRVVVAGGRVTEGGQVGPDGVATLPTMFMDCRPLPTVSVFSGAFVAGIFFVVLNEPADEPLTVNYSIVAGPMCVASPPTLTIPTGKTQASGHFIDLPSGFSDVTVILQEGEGYEIGTPGRVTLHAHC